MRDSGFTSYDQYIHPPVIDMHTRVEECPFEYGYHSSVFDFNTADPQQLDLIPDGAICRSRLSISPGGVGEGGWLTVSGQMDQLVLKCRFDVVQGPHARKRWWQALPVRSRGGGPGEPEAVSGARSMIRAMLECARMIDPEDDSGKAKAARCIASWADLDGLEFAVRVGLIKMNGGYGSRNVLAAVITPDREEYIPLMKGRPGDPFAAMGRLRDGWPKPSWAGEL